MLCFVFNFVGGGGGGGEEGLFAFSLLHAFCVHGFQAAENPWLWLCLGLACVYTSSSELSATAAICSPASLPFPSCPHSAAFPRAPGCDYIAERSSGTLLRTPSVRLYVVRVPFSKAYQQGSWSHSSFCLHPPPALSLLHLPLLTKPRHLHSYHKDPPTDASSCLPCAFFSRFQ